MSFYSQQLNYACLFVCVLLQCKSYDHVRNEIIDILGKRVDGGRAVEERRMAVGTRRRQIENAIKAIELMNFITSFLTHMQKQNLKVNKYPGHMRAATLELHFIA